MRRRRGSPVIWIALLLGFFAAALSLPRLTLIRRYTGQIFSPGSAPSRTTAIVFGAGLRRDGTPTLVLADRVAAAAALYRHGTVQSLLLSGSTRGPSYDEAEAMRALAVDLGVDPADILLDKQGTRTLETCLRASRSFGIRSALLVTQRFHLPRALVLCEALGIEADGVQADLSRYSTRSRWFWELRELPASLVAVVDAARARLALHAADQAVALPDSGEPHGS
jgi:vancomycin permeability regulator SanA